MEQNFDPNSQSNLPETPSKFSTSVLATGLVVGLLVYYFVKSNQQAPAPATQTNNQSPNPTQQQVAENFSVLSDQKLFDGSFYIEYNAWSPNSNKFFVTRDVVTGDLGYYGSSTHDVFDINQKILGKTNIAYPFFRTGPLWLDNNTLVAADKIATVSDVKNITLRDNISQTPSGYELLEEVKYYNSNTKESIKSVDKLTFSPDKKYAVFFSWYGSEAKSPDYEYQLFVMPQGAKSLSELINFGRVNLGLTSTLTINFSKNGKYIIVGGNAVFDVINQKAILTFEDDGGHRQSTHFSPDETKVLVIANNFSGYADEQVRIFIKDLINGQETEILSTTGRGSDIVYLDGSFSPDGSFVVFNSNKQLWIGSTITGEKKQLTTEMKSYTQPRWSSDGKKIVYSLPGKEIRLIELGN